MPLTLTLLLAPTLALLLLNPVARLLLLLLLLGCRTAGLHLGFRGALLLLLLVGCCGMPGSAAALLQEWQGAAKNLGEPRKTKK